MRRGPVTAPHAAQADSELRFSRLRIGDIGLTSVLFSVTFPLDKPSPVRGSLCGRPSLPMPHAAPKAEANSRRHERDVQRLRRASQAAHDGENTAMAAALAQIAAAFDEAAAINSFKIRVERLLRLP